MLRIQNNNSSLVGKNILALLRFIATWMTFFFCFYVCNCFQLNHESCPQGVQYYLDKTGLSLFGRESFFGTFWGVGGQYTEQRPRCLLLFAFAPLRYDARQLKSLAVRHLNLLSPWALESNWLLYHNSSSDISAVWFVSGVKGEKYWPQDMQFPCK